VTAVPGVARYLRLLSAFARFGLARELVFRGNFLVKVSVEVLWLCILLMFYDTVFAKTDVVAGWTRPQYLFFVGCYFALEGLMETFFLTNCSEFADLVRTGDLDFYLLKPIDEQFLITCREIDWSTVPNVFMGAAVMANALAQMGWAVDPGQVLAFLVMFGCGTALAYSFLLVLTSASVWFMRNQSLFEMWWLFTSLMRYPKEVFAGTWFEPVGRFFTYVIPILLVINVPARIMVEALDPKLMVLTLLATLILLYASRRFFKYALARYRSASS
jgi:ABC-2 type transport system permease protein